MEKVISFYPSRLTWNITSQRTKIAIILFHQTCLWKIDYRNVFLWNRLCRKINHDIEIYGNSAIELIIFDINRYRCPNAHKARHAIYQKKRHDPPTLTQNYILRCFNKDRVIEQYIMALDTLGDIHKPRGQLRVRG